MRASHKNPTERREARACPSPTDETTQNIQHFVIEVVGAEQVHDCYQVAWSAVDVRDGRKRTVITTRGWQPMLSTSWRRNRSAAR